MITKTELTTPLVVSQPRRNGELRRPGPRSGERSYEGTWRERCSQLARRPIGATWCATALALCLLVRPAGAHPEVPGAEQKQPVALIGGTIHRMVGRPIENGTLLFNKGKIVAWGEDVELPRGTKKIDVRGRQIYPGLINAGGDLGLIEIGAVRATRDARETGAINPNVKAQVAINPDSELIPVARAGGVLLAASRPSGSLISGTSAVLQLDGWSFEDMTLHAPIGMHIDWPRMTPITAWWEDDSPSEQIKRRDRELKQLEEAFDHAAAYVQAQADPEYRGAVDVRWEAMRPVLAGELPIIVEADSVSQIQAAVAFAARRKLKLIISGGYDAPRCAALLKQHQVPVIIGGVFRLPQRRDDPYDAPYTLANRLREAKIPYCICADSRFNAANMRNLPYHAATAAAYGLPRIEALRAITLYPAEILGVADRVGSLEVGKDATLIVTTGDPLDTPSEVVMAFIQGRPVDLNNRHKRLYEKYSEKYDQQGVPGR